MGHMFATQKLFLPILFLLHLLIFKFTHQIHCPLKSDIHTAFNLISNFDVLGVFLWWRHPLKNCLSPCKTRCTCLYRFVLNPDSFEVSVLLSEEGNWLFVCLFRWWQFPTRTEKRIHFCLPASLCQVDEGVSQPVVRPLKLWPHTSPSVGTTCHVVCPFLFQLWSNVILAERKQPRLLLLKLHTYSTLGLPYGEQIDCVVVSLQTGSIFFSHEARLSFVIMLLRSREE